MPDAPKQPSPQEPLGGGCLCGAVRYEITEPLTLAPLLPLHALSAPHRHGLLGERARAPLGLYAAQRRL